MGIQCHLEKSRKSKKTFLACSHLFIYSFPMKRKALLELARLRQSTRLDDFACIVDFHGGIFECDHVSPLTKSGNNVDAEIMVVAQDWSCTDRLEAEPPDMETAKLGYTPKLDMNKNLDDLLARHFGRTRAECYLTNVFPFIKYGRMNAPIKPSQRLYDCAQRFTFKEIEIVSPQIVICTGKIPFNALRHASGIPMVNSINQGVNSPFFIEQSKIYCVGHTGYYGIYGPSGRGREQNERDWQNIAKSLAG